MEARPDNPQASQVTPSHVVSSGAEVIDGVNRAPARAKPQRSGIAFQAVVDAKRGFAEAVTWRTVIEFLDRTACQEVGDKRYGVSLTVESV